MQTFTTNEQKLNILNINLFTPALLFSKVAFFLSPSKLRELWVIPPIFVIVTLTSMVVSWSLAKACRLRRSQRYVVLSTFRQFGLNTLVCSAFAIAAAMFMNSNSLPIALMQSLVITVHGLKWGRDDTRDSMLGRALTYLVLHSTFGMMLRWSFGVQLLAQADEETVVPPEEEIIPPLDINARETPNPRPKGHEREPLLGSSHGHRDYSSATLRSQSSTVFTHTDDETGDTSQSLPATPTNNKTSRLRRVLHQGGISHLDTAASVPPVNTDTLGHFAPMQRPTRPTMVNKKSHFFYSFPNTPQLSRTSLAPSNSELEQPDPIAQSPPEIPISTRIVSSLTHFASRTRLRLAKWGKSIKEFMTPPLYSALVSLIVACIPPLQHLLDVHLTPVKGAINSAGNCSIPITLVVLGGYFWRVDGNEEKAGETQPQGLRTDLPQQVQTAAPPFLRRKTQLRDRTDAPETQDNRESSTFAGGALTNEPSRIGGDGTETGASRPISGDTVVGSSSSGVTSTWSRAWMGLKSRSRAYAPGHAADDEHTTEHPPRDAESSARALLNGIPRPATASSKGRGEHKGEARTVLVAILSRMVITPMVLLPVMALAMSKTTMRLFDE